jgi:hypothetical protein
MIVGRLGSAAFDIEAFEVVSGNRVYIRLGGTPETLSVRLVRLAECVGGSTTSVEGEDEAALWKALRIIRPLSETDLLVKVPLTLAVIPLFDRRVSEAGGACRYSSGGNIGWALWPAGFERLDRLLGELSLSGVAIAGPAPRPLLGQIRGREFLWRVKSALDPDHHFPDF